MFQLVALKERTFLDHRCRRGQRVMWINNEVIRLESVRVSARFGFRSKEISKRSGLRVFGRDDVYKQHATIESRVMLECCSHRVMTH